MIDSGGMVVLFPEPVNPKAEAVMKSAKMTLGNHVAQSFSETEIDRDILVLAVEEEQKEKLITQYGDNGNIYTLCEFIGETCKVEDPYGGSLQTYGACLEKLSGLIDKLAGKLNALAAMTMDKE